VRPEGAKLAGTSPKRATATAWTGSCAGGRMAGVGSGWSGTAAWISFHEKALNVKQQFCVWLRVPAGKGKRKGVPERQGEPEGGVPPRAGPVGSS
jgi:hypothetical protein